MTVSQRHTPFAVLLGLAWAFACWFLIAERWHELGVRLLDADDAMRLVQVREFIAGQGWFDLYEPRLDPPTGYLTHWSRLIDAGLAGIFWTVRMVADADVAERVMRAAWPLLWLLAAMGGVAALTWRVAGRHAAVLALVIAACALPAFQHFKLGRIDHHNVQITLAVATLAAAAWSDRARHAAALAGMLTGLAVTIGLESLPFIALAAAAMAARFVFDRDAHVNGPSSAEQLSRYGIAVAASMTIGFLLSIAPARWDAVACDAIAINWLAPAAVAGVGCWIAGHSLGATTVRARVAALAIIGAGAIAAFLLIEPRCIAGPFALTARAVAGLWLDHVDETEPLLAAIRGFPLLGVWMSAFPVVAILASCALARDKAVRRDFGFLVAVAALLLSIAGMLAAVKIYSYAMWLAMPLVAAAASRVSLESSLRATAARLATAVMLTPTVVTAAGIIIAQAAAGTDPVKPGISERQACTRNDAYAALANLPVGVLAVEVNYGPYALALTPHAVLAAPYHRIDAGIVDAYALFNGPRRDARAIADRRRIDYIAICGHRTSTGAAPAAGSLWAQLDAGSVPDWLTPIPGGGDDRFAVYRVRR